MVQHPGRTTAARHGGRDIGKGARLRTVGGYKGEEREGRQARRAKKFGVSEWCGCSSSRVRIYSCYI